MFNTYHSTSLTALADHFSEILTVESITDPLEQRWVIVQNNEIKEWLSLQVASQNGIAGNFRFIFPSEFMWALYRLKYDEIPLVLPSDLNAMQWALFDLFSQEPDILKQIPYYETFTDGLDTRIQLSRQLADIFDQYQVYRPRMLEMWKEQKLVTKHRDERWQAFIWQKLTKKWKSDAATKELPQRPEAFLELLRLLEQRDSDLLNKIPEEIYIFGLSHTPRPFLELISRLAECRNVHLFSGNTEPIIESQPESLKKVLQNWAIPVVQQNELLEKFISGKGLDVKKSRLDDSNSTASLPQIEVHSCHNKRREVQVLKDEILNYLDKNPQRNADEILVMVPDAAEYASLIETIFENDQGEPSLPVSKLSGYGRQSSEYTLNAVLDLLSSSYKASEVLQVLNLEAIRNTYEFSEDDLESLERWIHDNKVFRGIGDSFNSLFSWQKAVNQLIAGFVMEPEDHELYKGLVPYQGISSTDNMRLASQFSRFIKVLKEAEQHCRTLKSPVEWIEFTEWLTRTFIHHEKELNSTSKLYEKLQKLKAQVFFAKAEESIAFHHIKGWLKSQFEDNKSTSGRFGQGITVSSYVPYRSVPFQFIAVLGMNENVFPRKATRPEYDLIYSDPEPGDRIQNEDDTFLFLETVFAAKEHLHISFEGQDLRSDSKRLPSILVQQLLDASHQEWENEITYHALHPFNEKYFSEDTQKRSYSGINLNLAREIKSSKTQPPSVFVDENFSIPELFEQNPIQISDLIYFFSHPSKYILQNGLGIYNYSEFAEIDDRELFKLQGLERYALDDHLFHALSRNIPEEEIFTFTKAASLLPDKLQGEKSFQNEKIQIQQLLQFIGEVTSEDEREEDIEIQVGDRKVHGSISGIFGDKLVSYRAGRRRVADEAGHWLKHLLLLKKNSGIRKSYFFSKEKEEIGIIRLDSAKISYEVLEKLVDWYSREGQITEKAAFFPETSKAYAESYLKHSDHKKAFSSAQRKWEYDSWSNKYAESIDYFNALMWRDKNPMEVEAFSENALRFWKGYLEAAEEIEHE